MNYLTTEKLKTFTKLREYIPESKGVFVSTIQLPFPHGTDLYETLVTLESNYATAELAFERYPTVEAALIGHLKHTLQWKQKHGGVVSIWDKLKELFG